MYWSTSGRASFEPSLSHLVKPHNIIESALVIRYVPHCTNGIPISSDFILILCMNDDNPE